MSTQVLYRALGLQGYEIVDCWESAHDISVVVEWPREKWCCPDCRSRRVTLHEWHQRSWRNVPIGLKPTWVHMSVPRVKCSDCGACRRIEVTFASPLQRHTKAFEKYASSLLQHMTPQDVAHYVGIAWGTANAIDQRRLQALPQPSLRRVTRIAIDEIYAGKRHKFLTLVLDLDSGAVLFVGSGRGAAALLPFFRKLQQSRAKIKAVAIDMAGGYIAAVRAHLPRATLVFDRFHIVKLMHDKLTQLRRDEYRLATDQHKSVLKGVRWLLLRNSDPAVTNSTRRKVNAASQPSAEVRRQQDRARLQAALDLNQPLATAYILKEELRLLWLQKSKPEAQTYLERWCQRASASGIAVLHTMSKTLLKHAQAILAWYDERITSARLEGTNNKIKLLQRRAYGYRNREHFELRILNIHHAKVRLVG